MNRLSLSLLVLVGLGSAVKPCLAQQGPRLALHHFTEIAPQGFWDRQNSWPWSMAWYKGKLYVGTSRSYFCALNAAINQVVPVYPPPDPDVDCAPDPEDLDLAAEIWSYDPANSVWTKVYEAPIDVPIPGSTKLVARDIGYRGMHVFTEPTGEEVLYVGSCSPKAIYAGLPGARLLRTEDGVNFNAVPQNPGTFLGDLNNGCFRGIETHNGRMYMIAGSFRGAGVVLESANPKLGDDNFAQITPTEASAYEIASFNGFLYVTINAERGFQLYKTAASGPLPYTYQNIIMDGGYKEPNGNPGALSMKVFNGNLYVGGNSVRAISTALCAISLSCGGAIFQNGGAELFRVRPNDTWDLIVGQARNTPVGYKAPLSGLAPGFSWPLNQHLWRMEVYDGRLYLGTYDTSTELRKTDGSPDSLAPGFGFDLFVSSDGVSFTAIDRTGFGDKFNYGVRSLEATPHGLFLGAANPFYGLRIYRGKAGN